MNVKEMIGGCIVCGEEQISDENSLIYCDGPCGHGFHQACYGVVEIPSGDWICRLCEYSVSHPKCELCPSTLGGFKPTGNKKWAHVICGLFLPEITFGDKTLMEPIILDGLNPEVYKKTCILCKTANDASYGVCVTCNHPSCKTSFHVTCGQAEGLLVEETVKSKCDPSDPGTTYFVAYCSSHLQKQQEYVAKNRANSSSMSYSYRIMPKIKLKDQLAHKSSSLNLSSSSSTSSSSPPSPASSSKKKASNGRSTSSTKDSRNNTKSVSKKSASTLDSISSFSPFTNGSAASLTNNFPSSFSTEHSAYKSSSNKLENLHRKSNKHKLESDSPSKSSKMDNTLSTFDVSAKHRIVSPSTTSVNQPPRKRHHSNSSSSSAKSSSDDSSDDSDSGSSRSSSSSSSSNRSRASNRSRKSNSSSSSSEDDSKSSSSSHSEEEVETNKAKKVSKKSQLIISETILDSTIYPKTTAAISKKAKPTTDSAISSTNNTSSESLHASSIDKTLSDKGKSSKPAKLSRTNVSSTKKDLLQKSSTSSLSSTSGTKLATSSDSPVKSDGSEDESLEYVKRPKKPQKAPKPKKASNAASSGRSSKKITSSRFVSSDDSSSDDEKCPTDASDEEKMKYKSEDDSDDFRVKKKSTKIPPAKKQATAEKKPRARSRTASSSSRRKKSVSDEPKPNIVPSGRRSRSPAKKELPQATAIVKSKPLAKDEATDPPVATPTRARRTSASRSPAKGKSVKISTPQIADLKPDVESMETDPVFVGESDSNTTSSPLRPHGGTMKTAPFVINRHDSRVMPPWVNDDSTMSSVLSPPHSYQSSFLSPPGRSTVEHSGLNIHIPVQSAKELPAASVAASRRISPRAAATSEANRPPHLENLLVPKTIEEFIEFQTVNTTNFLLGREENRDIAAMMRHLNSLVQENSQTEKSLESLTKELNCLMTLNKELKNVEIACTAINPQRSQLAELANGVNGDSFGKPRALTGTSGISSLIATPSISSSEMDSQSSCSMPTTNPTTFTSILNSKPSATPTLISSLNSVTPLAPTTTTASSMIYSNASHQPLSTATLQSSNTSMANILAANNHFNHHGQAPFNQTFPISCSQATGASRSRQREMNLSASLSVSTLYASSAGVHHPQPQQQAPLSSHSHSQVGGGGGGHSLAGLSNPALLSQLNQLVTPPVPTQDALRHFGTNGPYEQQQQHAASNGRHASLTRRNSGNLATSFNHHQAVANGVGTASTTSANRPYDNSLNHVATNGGPNSSHFYNHN